MNTKCDKCNEKSDITFTGDKEIHLCLGCWKDANDTLYKSLSLIKEASAKNDLQAHS